MSNLMYFSKRHMQGQAGDGALSDGCVVAAVASERPLHASDDPEWQTQSYTHPAWDKEEEESRDVFDPQGGGVSGPQPGRTISDSKTPLSPKLAKAEKSKGRPVHRLRHRMSMTDTPLAKLPNCLLEVCVLVGLDQETGVQYARNAQVSETASSPSLFTFPLEPQILAVISNQLAHFPNAKISIDPFYPPVQVKAAPKGFQRNPPPLKRRTSRRLSVKPRPATFPHNQEMIASLPTLCFPSEAYLLQSKPQESFQYLVLTSISGSRSYATCLVFHRQYFLVMTKAGQFELHAEMPITEDKKKAVKCFVPSCICAISSQPYFLVMKQCLSTLIPSLSQDYERMLQNLKDFTIQMTMVPTPPAGSLAVSFCMKDSFRPITVHPPDNPEKQAVDIPLNLPFLLFSVEDVLTIVTCILTQQRLVFMSRDYSVLTPIVECFLLFILPFKWPFVYVPVVSSSLLDLLEAPGCFIMGCNVTHRQRISENGVEGLVIIDIDKGHVEMCESINMPSIPEAGVMAFRRLYHLANSKQYDIASLSRPAATTLDADFSFRERLRRQYQQDIQRCFTEMYAVLFGDILEFMNFDQRRFKADEFIACRGDDEKEFYSVFLKTQLFKTYKLDRLDKKKDYYLNLDKRARFFSSESYSRRKFSSSLLVQSPNANRKVENQRGNVVPYTYFSLPSFPIPLASPHHFYDNCIEQISLSIKTVKSASVKASYLYLRGMFRIACSRPLDGLDDFHQLHTTDLSIFPVDEITKVVEDLSTSEKAELEEQEFYKRGEILKKVSQRKRPGGPTNPTIPEDIPIEGILGLSEFTQHVQNLEIVIDVDVIERLFSALTGGNIQGGLDVDSFVAFVDAWKEGELEGLKIPSEVYSERLDLTESILKISSLIMSKEGMGRLILSDKRLFFLTEGSNNFDEVIRIRDIECLEKFEQSYRLLSSAPALRIYSKRSNKEPYMANLKGERNSWYTLITEMWAGRAIADTQKDPHIAQQAARNICLLDAAIRSAENTGASYAKHLDIVSQILCHFTYMKSQGLASMGLETSNALVHKFNPSSNESQRSTVEAMIYTPGNRSDCNNEEDTSPRLWCAMGSGKVKVYNGSNFLLEAEIPEAKDRVCCLECIKGEQVWAGSFDTTIYIIDVHTYSANKQLMDHNDIVSDITVTENQSVAYTASLNGQIIEWDTMTLSKKNVIQLQNTDKLVSIKWDNISQRLWCCTKDDIRLIQRSGAVLQKFVYRDEQGFPVLLETFIITPNTLWAGCGRRGELVSWDKTSFKKQKVLKLECRGVSKLVAVNKRLWAASKDGKIHLFDLETGKYEKALTAHDDAIRSMTHAESRYVLTGAGSRDGKVAVWRTNFQI
ncbi:DENN domain-containing protein 3-like [Acanthaster planci]|uniref:DENN domain-containing protein 3-like n=1 Tax=Acanthaster planci TaxID=133434 RepID=A0A8B7YD05_ACAPL|nr:DENN domain-containing protein 3-like [Acanthaster planci]XP_022091139.1 DENN domain-containing protein 3-like [Acanthaster planci]XP_022091140.1 DENN domain-containing protein 3-like [Acanthaster planci]